MQAVFTVLKFPEHFLTWGEIHSSTGTLDCLTLETLVLDNHSKRLKILNVRDGKMSLSFTMLLLTCSSNWEKHPWDILNPMEDLKAKVVLQVRRRSSPTEKDRTENKNEIRPLLSNNFIIVYCEGT